MSLPGPAKTSLNVVGTIRKEMLDPGGAELVDGVLSNHLYHRVGNETNTKESRAEGERQCRCPPRVKPWIQLSWNHPPNSQVAWSMNHDFSFSQFKLGLYSIIKMVGNNMPGLVTSCRSMFPPYSSPHLTDFPTCTNLLAVPSLRSGTHHSLKYAASN